MESLLEVTGVLATDAGMSALWAPDALSGIESIGARVDDGLRVPLPAGRWSACVFMLDWAAEPGQEDDDGRPRPRPRPTALPDFVILINPRAAADGAYRTKIETFDR